MPGLFQQIRETLVPERVPSVHAETAVRQNRGLLSILDEMVVLVNRNGHLTENDVETMLALSDAGDGAATQVRGDATTRGFYLRKLRHPCFTTPSRSGVSS